MSEYTKEYYERYKQLGSEKKIIVVSVMIVVLVLVSYVISENMFIFLLLAVILAGIGINKWISIYKKKQKVINGKETD